MWSRRVKSTYAFTKPIDINRDVKLHSTLKSKTDTCFCGHSCSGAPLLKYRSNRLSLQKREILKEWKKKPLNDPQRGFTVNLNGSDGSCRLATSLSCFIRCFRSPDTQSSFLISSELKSFSVRQLRPFKLTESREADPMLERRVHTITSCSPLRSQIT